MLSLRSTTRLRRTAVAVAALALVAGACGGDDDDATDDTTADDGSVAIEGTTPADDPSRRTSCHRASKASRSRGLVPASSFPAGSS